jgi:hypothetical protein
MQTANAGHKLVISREFVILQHKEQHIFKKTYVVKDFTVSLRPRKPVITNDYLEYLGEFESIFETDLARESGSKGG